MLNVWNKWDPLKKVVLGQTYLPEFFAPIKNPRIRTTLQWIAEETHEDLDNFERVLKDYGCEVLRPYLDPKDDIRSYMEDGEMRGPVPRPPLQARDYFTVLGDTGFITGHDHPALYDLFKSLGFIDWLPDVPPELRARIDGGSNMFLVGRDLIVNLDTGRGTHTKLLPSHINQIKQAVPDVRIHYVDHDGHSDGSYHPLKPGCIISLKDVQSYDITYPGWDVLELEASDWKKRKVPWRANKSPIFNTWWAPGQDDNIELANYIDAWLNEWVGYVEESVFDVNVLMLDEKHACVSQVNNPQVLDYMKRNGIEPIHIPHRHSWFWDGGIHCITQELVREGTQQDYWPNGRDEVKDKRYD